MQAGHWLPGRHAAVLLDERNVHVQCYGCNVPNKGNPIKYWHFMEETYGKEIMDELERLDTTDPQYRIPYYEDKITEYKEKLRQYEQSTINWS